MARAIPWQATVTAVPRILPYGQQLIDRPCLRLYLKKEDGNDGHKA